MSKFMELDVKSPATLGEAKILEIVTAGKLHVRDTVEAATARGAHSFEPT
jgi:hypothetical protein